ncbi:MAG TPA: sugar ABC transporter substrate-binding protein [bacterium]|nr:sugar ABC transporter substrate-binding protein [bacterium]HPN32728.1 sugar ABC transporter substrate-binding protein [bacterium]
MKKKYTLIFFMSICLFYLIQGCSNKNESSIENIGQNTQPAEEAKSNDKILVGLSLPTLREERWRKDKEIIESESLKSGIELISCVADNDSVKQEEQCLEMIAKGVSVLILAPRDADKAANIVATAKEKGVKVISYDRLVLNADIDLYISFDNIKVGELQGKYLTKKVSKGNYIILSGAPTDNNSKMYKEGAMKFISPLVENKQINIIEEKDIEDWKPEEAKKIVKSVLKSRKNNVDAILAPNDLTAGGCIEAIAEKKLEGKIAVTGQDAELAAVKRIFKGTQSMTVFKDTRILASKAVEFSKKIALGEGLINLTKVNNGKKEVVSFLFEPIMVDKDNADTVLIQSGYLKKEDVYSN